MDNFIFISREMDPMAIADRLKDEGKNVVVGRIDEGEPGSKDRDECRKQLYDGILDIQPAEKVMRWMKDLPNKDEYFCFFDYGDLWEWSERALEMGFSKGLFPTEEGYELEDDRQKGKAFAKKHYPGLKVAPVHEFTKVQDAIKFLVEEKGKIFVLKSEGSNCETVVPTSTDTDLARRQLVGALLSERSDYEKGMTLEPKIQNAIEVSPVLVCWEGKPLFTLMELENKGLGAGNIGRLTGGCQNLLIKTPMDCPLNRIAFPPIIYEMAKKQPGLSIYDAGLLYDGKDFYFTEFCSQRFGWDSIFSEITMSGDANHKNATSRHFDLIAEGKDPIFWPYGAAVRLFQSEPSPDELDVYQAGYVVDWLDKYNDQLFFYCIQKKKPEESEDEALFVSNGYRRDFGVATGAGKTTMEAINAAYGAAGAVAMTGLLYRPKFDFLSRDYSTSIPNRYDAINRGGFIKGVRASDSSLHSLQRGERRLHRRPLPRLRQT